MLTPQTISERAPRLPEPKCAEGLAPDAGKNGVEYQAVERSARVAIREQKPLESRQKSEIGGEKSRKKSRTSCGSSRVVLQARLEAEKFFPVVEPPLLPMVKAAMERDRLAREGRAPWTPGPGRDFAALIARAERRERRCPTAR